MKKKRFLGILLSLALMLGLMPALSLTAYADDVTNYELWVGGKQVTSANASDVFGDGTVSFTPEYGETPAILTLNGYNYSGSGYKVSDDLSGVISCHRMHLTISLRGNNSINVASDSDYSEGIKTTKCDLTITGDGTLSVSGREMGINGIDGELTIQSGTVNVTGSFVGIIFDRDIFIGEDVTSLVATGTGTDSPQAICVVQDDCHLKNYIAGTGWTNAEGSGKGTEIDVNSYPGHPFEDYMTYKKVQFPAASDDTIPIGSIHKVEGSTYIVKTASTVCLKKAASKKSFKLPAAVKIKGKTFKVTGMQDKAFKGTGVKTVTVKSKKLTKKSVKDSLKGSKVKTVIVKVGNKKENKEYVKKYKKYFTKKNAGKKVKVSL